MAKIRNNPPLTLYPPSEEELKRQTEVKEKFFAAQTMEAKSGAKNFPASIIVLMPPIRQLAEELELASARSAPLHNQILNNHAIRIDQLCAEIQHPSTKTVEGRKFVVGELVRALSNTAEIIRIGLQCSKEEVYQPVWENDLRNPYADIIRGLDKQTAYLREELGEEVAQKLEIKPTQKLEPAKPSGFASRLCKSSLSAAACLTLGFIMRGQPMSKEAVENEAETNTIAETSAISKPPTLIKPENIQLLRDINAQKPSSLER